MFKIQWKYINEVLNMKYYWDNTLYEISKNDDEDKDMFEYQIELNWIQYDSIREDIMIKLHTIYIKNKMKDERDFYQWEIKWINYFIYRIYWHLNWYIELSEEQYYQIDTSTIDVHWWITFEWDIKDLNLPAWNYRINSKAIWFYTAHAWDAFLFEWFEYTLVNWEYRDYQFVYNELVKLVNQLPKEILTTDWQRYLKNFIQEVKDFENLSELDFFMKYCLSWEEEHDIKKEYETYSKYEMQEDELDYEDWLCEVYYEENQDSINERVREYTDPLLDFIKYEDTNPNSYNSIYEITLACWWPNIYLTINTRWSSVLYEFIWWWERLSEDLSYLYDEIISYYNIE